MVDVGQITAPVAVLVAAPEVEVGTADLGRTFADAKRVKSRTERLDSTEICTIMNV